MAVYESKTATKDGRRWYFSVRYETASGIKDREKSKKYFTENEAIRAEEKFLASVKDTPDDITFNELYERYLAWCDFNKDSTTVTKINRIENHLLPFFGKMKIAKINIHTVTNWKKEKNEATKSNGEKYKLSYRQSLFKELSVLLNFGVDFCGLKKNVAYKARNFRDKDEGVIEDEEKIKYITATEYNYFISTVIDIVYKTFFAFLYYMGVRKGEAQALTWKDILWDTHIVRISKTLTVKTEKRNGNKEKIKITNTKNRKNRRIGMIPLLENMLRELYEYYKQFEGFNDNWFVFGGDRHLASTNIDREKDNCFALTNHIYNLNIKRITCHEFRHSNASYLFSNGVDILGVAKRLGDTVEVVEKTYAHFLPEVDDRAMEKLALVENQYAIAPIHQDIKKEFLKSQQASKILSNC